MARSSEAFREKMRKRKKAVTSKGLVIDKKDWTKGRVRLLPSHGEDPAREFRSFFCREIGKSCTSPRTFGVVDPLNDRLDLIYKSGEKDEKEHAKDFVSRSTEFWVPCVVRGDEGTADNPNVRIFRLPNKVYQYICDAIGDEDYGEDVTDAEDGRDILIKREGKGINTAWSADKMDKEPIASDPELAEAIDEMSTTFDVSHHFFPFNLEDYTAIYQGLTGEDLPADTLDALEALERGESVSDDDEYEEDEDEGEDEYEEDEDGGDEYEEDDDEGDDDEGDDDEGDDESDEELLLLSDPPDGIEFGKTVVEFETDDGTSVGVVQSWSADPDDPEEFVLAIVGDEDDSDEPWLIDEGAVTIVDVSDEDDEALEEEEAEEAEPTVKRRNPPRRPKASDSIRKNASKKTTRKKATTKKTTRKAAPKTSKKTTRKKATTKKTTRKAASKKKATTRKKTTRKAASKKKTTSRKRR